MNNQRQLFLGVQIYSDKYSSWLPVQGSNGSWRGEIAPFVTEDDVFLNWSGTDCVTLLQNEVYWCPSCKPNSISHYAVSGLGWNWQYAGLKDDSSYPRITQRSIAHPSSMIIFGCTSDDTENGTRLTQPVYLYSPAYSWADVGERHNFGVNMTFADGHTIWHEKIYLYNHSNLYMGIP
jgi:prepilin-type processing-associated H-X9-DG protein